MREDAELREVSTHHRHFPSKVIPSGFGLYSISEDSDIAAHPQRPRVNFVKTWKNESCGGGLEERILAGRFNFKMAAKAMAEKLKTKAKQLHNRV